MPAPGANLQYGNNISLTKLLLKALGINAPGIVIPKRTTSTKSGVNQGDLGTTFPRQIGLCMKASAPVNNAAGDAPTGVGDICVVDNAGRPYPTVTIYRCSAYVSNVNHTWAQIV